MLETSTGYSSSRVIRTDTPPVEPAAGYGLRGTAGQHWSSPYAGKRIHLIGIGGSGMRGLAGVLLRCGARVSGSDRADGLELQDLAAAGASVRVGQAADNIPEGCDIVIYSAAVKDDNVELTEARRRGTQTRKYAQMLGEVMRLRTGMAVAGTHGKSTTTAMLAYVLRRAKLDPTFVVGAGVDQLGGSSGVGDGPHFVVEACEYDSSFLNYAPRYAAILNIEEDHLDYYNDMNGIIAAFREFASLVPADGVLIANGADRAVAAAVRDLKTPIESFGFDEEAYWSVRDVQSEAGAYRFRVMRRGQELTQVELRHLRGRHHVGNALVAAALAHHGGVAPEVIREALAEFRGAQRRLTHLGTGRDIDIDIYDDYGHHPTEIQVTLKAVRERWPGRRLWVIFQPHQHSRTRFLLNDFARSFGLADRLIVPDIYFVRDSQAERDAICSADLVERVRANGGDAEYLPDFESIVARLSAECRSGDVVLTMGAGDIWKVADDLVRRLA